MHAVGFALRYFDLSEVEWNTILDKWIRNIYLCEICKEIRIKIILWIKRLIF